MYTPPPKRWRAAIALLCLAAAGCSSGVHARASATTTTVLAPGAVTADAWSPPAPPAGGPTTAGFCTMLVALYQHMAELPHAADLSVSKQIVGDYITYAPEVVTAAPASIHGPANTYMTAVASYLATMSAADFEAKKVPAGSLKVITEPSVTTAAKTLLTYSQDDCHYTIGG